MSSDPASAGGSDDGSAAGNSPNLKKKIPQKKHYPFGTPSHKTTPFSQYNHLNVSDYLLFHELSSSGPPIEAEIRTGAEEKKKTRGKTSEKKINDDFLKYAETEKKSDGVEPCKRIDCRMVQRKIIESLNTLQMERDDIGVEIDQLAEEAVAAERENAVFEEKFKIISRENDQLEATLQHLNAKLKKLEGKKFELQQEREEFGNRMMMTESEKQNWLRQMQLANKALADAMWRGQESTEQAKISEIILRRRTSRTQDDDHVSHTSYSSLANGHVIDYTERPVALSTSSIPAYLKSQLLPSFAIPADDRSVNSGMSATWTKQSSVFVPGNSRSLHSILSSVNADSRAHLEPLKSSDKIRNKLLKLSRTNTPYAHVSGDAFVGYTPTGAPQRRGLRTSEGMPRLNEKTISRMSKSMSDLGLIEPSDLVGKLDPVFYNARATTSFSRTQPVGQIRMRKDQIDFSRLMTYQHPGMAKTKDKNS